MNLIERLHSKALIKPPGFVIGGTQYLTIMGSVAYAVSSDTSDMDLYGFCIPPKDIVFPHLAGEIHGFGKQIQRFEQMVDMTEKYYTKKADSKAHYYLGNAGMDIAGGTIFIVKTVRDKAVSFNVPTLGICDTLSSHVSTDSYGLQFAWRLP